jgi:hypothetical protein
MANNNRFISLSAQNAANQTVTVLDCSTATCPSPSTVLNNVVGLLTQAISPLQSDNLALPINAFTPTDQQQVFVANLNNTRIRQNSFNSVRMSYADLLIMNARYGMTNSDAPVVARVDSGTYTTSASAWTSFSTAPAIVSPNTDYVYVPVLSQRLRLFAQMVRVTVPVSVYAVEFSLSGTASPYPELIRIELQEDDCRDLFLMSFQKAQSYRFVGSSSIPVSGLSIHYKLPFETADQEAADGGASLYLRIRCFDSTGAQVVAICPIYVYGIPYTPALINALSPNKGITGTVAWQQAMATFTVPDTQNY